MKNVSIGVRLAAWYTVMFAVAQLAFGIALWVAARHSVYSVAHETLEDRVEGVRRFLQSQPQDYDEAQLQEEVNEAYLQLREGDYLQVSDSGGNWLYRAKAMADQNIAEMPKAHPGRGRTFEEREVAGEKFLLIFQPIEVYGRKYRVDAAVSMDELLETLSRFEWKLILFTPLVLLAAAAGGYSMSRRALAPVDAITTSARTIGGQNLGARLDPLHTGDELQRLAETLNEMLARIERAFQRITEFTADASHELRTPISLMRTEAEISLRKDRTAAEYRDALQNILREAERTSDLIESLLSLARADSGAATLSFEILNLREVAEQAVRDGQKLSQARQLQFVTDLSGGDFPILGNGQSLRRVMNILLDNAIKYTPINGTIELAMSRRNGSAVVQIRDSGIGIGEDELPKIFERFYRADKARSREMGGAGLGLAIAQWIIQQHRGTIQAESVVGAGSVFIVQLPLSDDLGK